MNFTRAFSYAFEDRDWTVKLLTTLGVTLGAVLLTPVLIGFVLWAALLGYLVDLVRNVRLGVPRPLPAWNNFGALISRGGNVLIAFIIYNLPNILLGCCTWLMTTGLNSSITGTTVALGLACCVFPLMLIFNIIVWPMLAIGVARFADEGRTGVFFEFPALFRLVQTHTDGTIRYLVSVLLANLALSLFALIPCIGWFGAPALALPVHGYLMGQYAAGVLGKPKQRPAAPPPAPPAARPPYRR